MSMPIDFPVGPTLSAARNTSRPPPHPRSTTVSPGRRVANAVGLPHESPILASAGMDANSSGEYPNASATARTPSWFVDNPAFATEAYLSRTTSWTDISLSSQARQQFFDLRFNQVSNGSELFRSHMFWVGYLPVFMPSGS